MSQTHSVPASDVGRRLVQRRGELGLSREEVARRAGVAPGYLQYVEEESSASPGPSFMLRVADALETTAARLRGGDSGRPPGIGRAAAHPVLSELGAEESLALLSDHGVGRIALTTDEGPVVLPVNYDVVDGAVVYRTTESGTAALAAGRDVAFEVDRIDDAMSEGWSVLVSGPAAEVTDTLTLTDLRRRAHTSPWAGGERHLWMRIEPVRVTGRRITAGRG